jgi:hypothetical protein
VYGTWRTDKEKVPGYSHELISSDFKYIADQTTMDELEAFPYPGLTTGLDMLRNSLEKRPNMNALGTRNGDSYTWLNWKQVHDMAENLSAGIADAGLTPEVEAEGKVWKFIGI